jgi:hypothetical protein
METEEEILTRHRKEVKDLTAKTTALKKTVSKGAGDKKKVPTNESGMHFCYG